MASIETQPLVEEKTRPADVSLDGVTLVRNTAFNLAGQVLPLLAGVVLIPYIIRGLGADRFGMLGIIWIVFGYFSLIDLGLGRATTKFVAEHLAKSESTHVSEMVWNSILLQIALGVISGAILFLLTPALVQKVLRTPLSLVGEGRTAFYVLATAMPAVLGMNALRAVLEGCQRFDLVNLLRVPSSILAFVIPAIAVAVGLRLPGIVLWMAISRLAFALGHGYFCLTVLPNLRSRPSFRWHTVRPLLSFGGWVTASNLVNPILLSMDRFLIGSLISVAMVGYYTAPFEAVTKLWMIPASLMTTVYPACSALGAEHMHELQTLYSRSIKYIFCALAPVSLMLVIFARPIIGVWLGPGFVDKSAVPLQLLAIGVFINSFAHVPYCFLQALGRPDTTAKLFVCELIPYGLLVWWMIERRGIAGAATAWSIRVSVEILLLLWIAWKVFSLSPIRVVDRRMWTALAALCAAGVAIFETDQFLRATIAVDLGICAVWLLGFAVVVWNGVLDHTDRASAMAILRPRRTAFVEPLERADAG